MQPSIDQPTGDRSRAVRRYGPIAIVVAVIAVVAIVVATSGGSSSKKVTTSTTTAPTQASLTGALSFSQAKAEGRSVAWPATCDTTTGRLALPEPFPPECYAPIANNGGGTANGVTGSTINVVLYLPEPHDPVLSYVEGAIAITDTQAQTEATYRGYIKIFEHFYNTYGRKVNLVVLHASGLSTDEVAARADAVKAATELNAFAVWGGPVLTTAWADELAARHVICLGCAGGTTPDWYAQRPYVYPITALAKQGEVEAIEYLTKKIAGRPASHAGDPALAAKTRKFGLLYISTDANTQALATDFANQMAAKGDPLAISVPYTLDPARLQEEAASAIAKLKSAGVTSVLFSGDPVAPVSFTKEATAQNYFPEWILTGSALVDTTVFARTYDQKQWAHAFGISQLTARTEPQLTPSYSLYQWALGTPPPAANLNAVLFPQPALFYSAIQAAGPDLTTDTFRTGLFSIPPGNETLTAAEISYGNHSIWPYTDYAGIDDATELWWNPTATGPDEIRRNGTGMYEYVDGGKRYLPGQWPATDSTVFDPAGAVTIYTTAPPGEAAKSYPSPTGL